MRREYDTDNVDWQNIIHFLIVLNFLLMDSSDVLIIFRFIEGDFDRYISRIRKPHVWGGEPELLMASHVLRMPITVYMYDKDRGGLITIAEYGQEYGKENPIRVLYHGFGHYDALQIPAKDGRSRL